MEPKFRGLGYCMIFIRMIVNAYSPVVMSWSIYYLGATFLSLTVSEKMSFEQSAIFFLSHAFASQVFQSFLRCGMWGSFFISGSRPLII